MVLSDSGVEGVGKYRWSKAWFILHCICVVLRCTIYCIAVLQASEFEVQCIAVKYEQSFTVIVMNLVHRTEGWGAFVLVPAE